MIAEISRLQCCSDILTVFYRYAQQCEVEVCKGSWCTKSDINRSLLTTIIEFQVTVAYLAREAYSSDSPPKTLSPASGRIEVSDLDPFQEDDCPDGAYWLIEPRQHTEVKRYSGTMDHTTREHGKDALTISAFTHFAYIYSKKQVVSPMYKVCLVVIGPFYLLTSSLQRKSLQIRRDSVFARCLTS